MAKTLATFGVGTAPVASKKTTEFVWLREPWKHQREIFERAKVMQDYALFMEMGTGKTFETINLLRWRYLQAGRMMRTLVFCPPIVCTNWVREFEMASKVGKMVKVLRGSASDRKGDLERFGWAIPSGEATGAIFVTNYESLAMKDLFAAMMKWRPEILVFDESHKLKSYKAKRTKLAIKLSDIARHKYLLSGSPILNTPMDIWAQYRILDGGRTFDRNFVAFRARYFVDKNAGMPKEKYFQKWEPIDGIAPEFNALIYKKASRVLKKDCLDLPPLVRKTLEVELSPEQKRTYKEMHRDLIAYLDDKACVARIALTKALRLQQMVTGHVVTDTGEILSYDPLPRLELTRELVKELAPDHKIILWSCFREDAKKLGEMLLELGFAHRVLVGGMTPKAQQEAIDSFQKDPTVRVVIANQQAAGVGVNLTAASYAIYYSRNFSLEADLQSESRNHRGGSEVHEKITRVDLVCPKTIDEVILLALHRKENMAENILSLKAQLTGSVSAK